MTKRQLPKPPIAEAAAKEPDDPRGRPADTSGPKADAVAVERTLVSR